MKKILLFAFVLILTACSAQPPQVTSTLPPTSTPLPTPTETLVPTITPTSIPTLATFSPETWAGTDQVRIDFLATLDSLGFPRENLTCGENGACFDLEGNKLGENGKFNFSIAKEIAVKYGRPMPTQYGPATGNVRPGTPSKDVNTYVTWPLMQDVNKILKKMLVGYNPANGSYHEFSLNLKTNSWAITTTTHIGSESYSFFAFKNEDEKIIVVPIP